MHSHAIAILSIAMCECMSKILSLSYFGRFLNSAKVFLQKKKLFAMSFMLLLLLIFFLMLSTDRFSSLSYSRMEIFHLHTSNIIAKNANIFQILEKN